LLAFFEKGTLLFIPAIIGSVSEAVNAVEAVDAVNVVEVVDVCVVTVGYGTAPHPPRHTLFVDTSALSAEDNLQAALLFLPRTPVCFREPLLTMTSKLEARSRGQYVPWWSQAMLMLRPHCTCYKYIPFVW
jgi:hypothetical protein